MSNSKMTVSLIAHELHRAMGAKRVQILMAYDPIYDQFQWRAWVDGKTILAQPIRALDMDLSLNDFAEKHIYPVKEMLLGGLGFEQFARDMPPQGCALWAEVEQTVA